ncbi:MAG: NAD(P)-dependent oxidoreductase [Nitrososphaerales archaeon]
MDEISENKPRIGFIGLGIMGKPMASNLLHAGYSVTVYNRSKTSVEELVLKGAASADTPKKLAQQADIVIDMVTDAPDVEQVILQKDGVAELARRGLVVIDMSTNSPETAMSISSQLENRGLEFLDAPVTGGDKGAREGTLTIMVGGKKEIFEKCLVIFKAMGKEIAYMGPSGAGQATKLCNQAAVAVNALATCEALLLGSAYNLPIKELLRVLTSGAASSWSLNNLGPRIASGDFEPGFKSANLHKDLKYIMRVAEKKRLALPGSAMVQQLFNAVMAQDLGERGTQVLSKVLANLSKHDTL